MSQSRQETPVPETKKPKATVFQSVAMGSVAGAVEVAVNHPLWTIKTRSQAGDPFTLKPSVLYRGIFLNAASMMPITAMQVGLNRFVQNVIFKDTKELSNSQQVASSFVAGVSSALISCPTEMVMTYQGEGVDKVNFQTAYNYLAKRGGLKCLFNGLSATAMKEGIFTVFFLAATPVLKSNLQPFFTHDSSGYKASLAAGISAGLCATVTTQYLDTVKTVQQKSDPAKPLSVYGAVNKIYSTQGIYGFFRGGVPRGARVMSAVTIMGLVTEKMEAKFRQK